MSDLHALFAGVREQLGSRLSGLTLARGRGLHARATTADMPAVADVLQSRFGADLALMAGDDRRDDAGCFQVHYVFDHKRDDWYAHVTTDVTPGNLELVSLAEHSYPASRFEREIRDLFGITPVGHPDPRPLVRHGFWPEDYFPLRRDTLQRSFEDDGRPFPFGQVEGPGVYEIPVGPVHAGIIEPGHFRFQCHGEQVMHLEISLGYQHRGVLRGLNAGDAKRRLHYVETLAGDTSIGHGAEQRRLDPWLHVRRHGFRQRLRGCRVIRSLKTRLL